MFHREISMEELVSYLQGTASEQLKQEIDSQRQADEDFEEELQNWEAYIEDHEDPEKAVQRIMTIHTVWKNTPIEEVASSGPTAASVKPLWARPTILLSVAAAIALLLLSTGIINWTETARIDYQEMASQEVDRELSRILDIQATASVDTGSLQAKLKHAYAVEGDSGLVVLIDQLPEAARTEEIRLLHALALSQTQAQEEALWILDTLAKVSAEDKIRCNSIWNGFWIALELEKWKAKDWASKWDMKDRGINCSELFPAKDKKIKEVMVNF
ncbi:MAG: hypothetical protein AAFR59_03140 [Bacteroidota bacterium]